MAEHIDVISNEKCSGCTGCSFVCPVNAITYRRDMEGFSIPVVNESYCINCGRCIEYCHLQSGRSLKTFKVSSQYAVKLKDEEKRKHSRSGGVFVALSDAILDMNGVVIGAVMNKNFQVYHTLSDSKEVRDSMCGSKYVQSDMFGIYEKIEDKLKSKIPVFVTGTPCQIGEVARIFNPEKYSNLFLCDFICHGVPSPGLWEDYLSWIELKYKEIPKYIEFRDKNKYPWESHVQRLDFEKKQIWSKRFTNLFTSNNCLRECCYNCPYTTPIRSSDFTIADYWGIDDISREFNDGKGISLLMLRTQKAKLLFEKIIPYIDYLDTSDFECIHYNLKRPTARPKTRDKYRETYLNKGFETISKMYGGYDLPHRIKYKIVDHLE